MLRRTLTMLLGLAAIVATAMADAQTPLPSGETLLDNHVRAIGGRSVFDKLTTRAIKAQLDMPAANVSLTLSAWAARPNKIRMLIESDVVGRVERGFDGTVAWELSTTSGPRLLEGPELDDTARDSAFDGLAGWRTWVVKAQTQALVDVEGKPAYQVLVTPKRGAPQTYFFDKASSLAVKVAMTVRTPMGDAPAETYFGDYREVDGVRIPHTIRQVAPGVNLITTVEAVAHNGQVPAGRFDLPKEIQALAANK